MPGRLTTHVLDTATGKPAVGLTLRLYRLDAGNRALVAAVATNSDGRVDAPLLTPETMTPGVYEIEFDAGAYLRWSGVSLPTFSFLDVIPIRFGITDVTQHYHVPLLLSPYSYATYRGS